MLSPRRVTVAMAVAALLVQACVLIAVTLRTGRLDGYAFASLDAQEFHRLAVNLADHGDFSQSERAPFTPDTWRTPGYPLFLAPFVLLAGDSPAFLVVVQQVLSAACVVLFLLIARAHLDERRALLATLLFLFEPYRLFYSTWLMSETLFTFLLLLIWSGWTKALRKPRPAEFLLVGGLCGLAVLVRPLALLLPVVLLSGLIGAAWLDARRAIRRRPRDWALPAALTFALAAAFPPAAWCARNLHIAGHFALSHQGGIVLAYFKSAEVMLWRQGRAEDRYVETSLNAQRLDWPHSAWDEIDRRLRNRLAFLPDDMRMSLSWRNLAQGNRTKADAFAVSSALMAIGRDELLAHPWSTFTCYAARALELLTFPLTLTVAPASDASPQRLRYGAQGAPYAVLVLMVWLAAMRGRWTAAAVFFPVAVILALLATSLPQLDPRFRVPMIPMLLILAFLTGRRRTREDLECRKKRCDRLTDTFTHGR